MIDGLNQFPTPSVHNVSDLSFHAAAQLLLDSYPVHALWRETASTAAILFALRPPKYHISTTCGLRESNFNNSFSPSSNCTTPNHPFRFRCENSTMLDHRLSNQA